MEKITIYLMNQKGWSVLSAVLNRFGAGVISAVVTARDAAMIKDYYQEIKDLAGKHNIPVYDRTDAFIPSSSFKLAIGWRWIIPGNEKLIVLHDSPLPRYRGFAPLVTMLINGEKELGVTALYATDEYDKGAIIGQRILPVTYPITIAKAIEQVSNLYEILVMDIVDQLVKGKMPEAAIQDESQASYSLWREETDYRIDWKQSAESIRRFIDAVGFPYKGASSFAGDSLVRILAGEEVPDVKIENRQEGKIIFMKNGCPVVVCGQGLLSLTGLTDETGKSLLPFTKFRVRFT